MKYDVTKTVNLSFTEAIGKVTGELKKEGFGVLTEIDVKATLKKKLDIDFTPYMILGACNPPAAHKALETDNAIGLLLPCNVVVYVNKEGRTVVSAIDAEAMMSVVDHPGVNEIAREISAKLRRVIDAV